MSEKRMMIDLNDPTLSITAQCILLNLSRAGYYYKEKGESDLNLKLMNRIDEIYTAHPTRGSRKLRDFLRNEGYNKVNRKRIQRLMRKMGIEVIYPKKKLSTAHPDFKIYPYLLRGLAIERPNQVWCTVCV